MVASGTHHLSEPFPFGMFYNQTRTYLPNELISFSPVKKKIIIINVNVFNTKLSLHQSALFQLLSGSRLGKREVEDQALFQKTVT